MTILLTGGGSGGHITPVMAVAEEIKKVDSSIKIVYIGQKGDRFARIVKDSEFIDKVFLISAGKFRRFHGEGIKQIFNLIDILKNTRDFFYVLIGIIESFFLIKKLKPNVLFSRGGYVSVPVALGAKLNHVPYITHDSDPIPSLANRIIAPWATLHAVALDKELYPYPQDKTITTGIPLNKHFISVNEKLKNTYRAKIKIPDKAQLVFVVGGGLGAQRLNEAIIKIAPDILDRFKDLYICHVAGEVNFQDVKKQYQHKLNEDCLRRVQVFGYINDIYKYSGAADVIVSRAGATNLSEFALQAKPCVIIPSPYLTGGHQIKNADYLSKKNAAIVIQESELDNLKNVLEDLLNNKPKQLKLSNNINELAVKDATKKISAIIVGLANNEKAIQS